VDEKLGTLVLADFARTFDRFLLRIEHLGCSIRATAPDGPTFVMRNNVLRYLVRHRILTLLNRPLMEKVPAADGAGSSSRQQVNGARTSSGFHTQGWCKPKTCGSH
jgi:hypothetical protein